jgi:hypothetical protein
VKRKIVGIEGVIDEEEVKSGYQEMAHFMMDVVLTTFVEFRLWESSQGGREIESTPLAYKYELGKDLVGPKELCNLTRKMCELYGQYKSPHLGYIIEVRVRYMKSVHQVPSR